MSFNDAQSLFTRLAFASNQSRWKGQNHTRSRRAISGELFLCFQNASYMENERVRQEALSISSIDKCICHQLGYQWATQRRYRQDVWPLESLARWVWFKPVGLSGWKWRIDGYDPRLFMPCGYGRALGGARCQEFASAGHWKTMTLMPVYASMDWRHPGVWIGHEWRSPQGISTFTIRPDFKIRRHRHLWQLAGA